TVRRGHHSRGPPAALTNVRSARSAVAAAGDVEDRSPVASHGAVRAAAQPETDLAVEPFALPALHGDVAREGVQQLDVSLGVVDALPVEVPNVPHLEQATRLDLGPSLLQLPIAGHQAGDRDEVLQQVVGIVGTGPLVDLGGAIERLSQHPPVGIGGRRAAHRSSRAPYSAATTAMALTSTRNRGLARPAT